MTRRIFVAAALLIPAVFTSSVAAIEENKGRPETSAKQPADEGVRQREGGERAAPEATRQGRRDGAGREGTEDGLPEVQAEAFGRRERLIVEPRWRLGVYAYNTDTGVVITRVIPGSAAWRVGFEPGDRIVTVGGFQVGSVGERMYYLGEELQHRADPRGRVRILAQNVRGRGLLNIDVQLDSQRHREPPFPLPRERLEGERPKR
jgi:hypothetical protein